MSEGQLPGNAGWLRVSLREAGIGPAISGTLFRKRPIADENCRCGDRWSAEGMSCRVEDFRRIAARTSKQRRGTVHGL